MESSTSMVGGAGPGTGTGTTTPRVSGADIDIALGTIVVVVTLVVIGGDLVEGGGGGKGVCVKGLACIVFVFMCNVCVLFWVRVARFMLCIYIRGYGII